MGEDPASSPIIRKFNITLIKAKTNSQKYIASW